MFMKLEYKFSYGNIFNFIFSEFFLIVYNSFSLLLVSIFMAVIYGDLEYKFRDNYIFVKVITIFMVILFTIYFSFLIVIFFLPKKVIINGEVLIVKRYMLNFKYIFRGFNDKIFIEKIIECHIYNGERPRLDRSKEYAVFFFNWDDLVEIVTDKNRKYLVPVKNSENFIEEINAKIKQHQIFNELKIDNLLVDKSGKKINYSDCKVLWKSKGEIDSIYYIDESGEKVEIIHY